MKKNNLENFLFSVVGVIAMLVIAISLYLIAGVIKHRFDLTDENVYTLSSGTRAVLKKLDTPVEIRFYYSQDSKQMPVMLKTFAQRVEDLLAEYRKNSGGKIQIKKYDPQPDSDAEDLANMDGVEGQMIDLGEKIYLGLAISMLDAKVTLPFISPERERLLEYDLTRAITRVTSPTRPVIGVMSSLPVFGMPMNPMMMQMGRQQGQDPWVFISELKRDFEVREVEMTAAEIPADVKVLLVVHPKGISDAAQFAIDQFVLRGGKLVAFVDPLSIVDSRNSPGNPLQAAASGGSSMDKLFKAWGLTFEQSKVVADLNFATMINQGGRAESAPAVLSLTKDALNEADVVTAQIDSILIPFAGAFTGTPAEGLTQTALIETSENSQLVDRFMAEFSNEQVRKEFKAAGKKQTIALRLTGKFKTAFPEGKPKETPANPDEKKEEAPAGESLKEAASDTAVILVGDTDLLFDQFSVQVQQFFNQRIVVPRNGNLNLVQNMSEQMSGDNNLIAIRSRATMNRPFTRVREMQAKAEAGYREKISALEKDLADTQSKLNELQRQKEGNQRFMLSKEQQDEIARFRQKEAQASKDLREVRKNLRREIDSLENRLKWTNIAGMPLLVTAAGIGLALIKRKRTAAK